MNRKQTLLLEWLVIVLGVLSSTAATPQKVNSSPVFRIGVFDRSSSEFAGGTPAQPVTFVVGQSQPDKNWYAVQPVEFISPAGPLNADIASSPRTIRFSLPHVSGAPYRMHISLLIESACVPAIRVGINGKSGIFYLQPKLDFAMGDGIAAFNAVYSHADVEFAIPDGYLHPAENTITLQAIENETEVIPDALVAYDAIELDQNAAFPAPAPEIVPKIVPTIFYERHNGQLEEDIDVFLRSSTNIRHGSVDLSINEKKYHQPLLAGQDFGDARAEFSVPAFTSPARATIEWVINGRKQREEQSITPAKKWTVFLVPHIHLDVGFTDYQGKVGAAQSRAIDEAMDLTTRHPDFRFSLDGEWPFSQFMATATPAQRQRAIAAVRNREVFLPAQYANILTGFPTAETLIRSLYPSANLSRESGTPFDYANITDVPSYSWSYASILAAAGIKEFLAASDNYRAPVLMQGHLNETSPFWWEGPDGGKVLFWDSRGYGQLKITFSKLSQVSAGRDALPIVLQQYDSPGYRADAAILFGSQGENSDLYPQQADLADRWNRVYAYPHLQYSGVPDALETIARQLGDQIPTIRGDGGPYWEDGVASDSFYAAMERANESRALSAEKLATLSSVVNPRLAVNKAEVDQMWRDMVLMDEHTWTGRRSVNDPASDEVVKQLAFKNQFAINAHLLVDSVMQNSMERIADSVSGGVGSLFVFNMLNWSRDGLVTIDLNKQTDVVDPSTGQVIPVEVLSNGNTLRRVSFIAPNVPPLGYKRFELRHEEKPAPSAEAASGSGTVMENAYYRVVLDPSTGAVRSIYDKQLQRELVDQQSPYRFGQYLYVTGGDHLRSSLLQYRVASPKPSLRIDRSHDGHLLSVLRTPYGWVARMESTDTNTPAITTEVRLFENEKKIEFVENVDKKEVDSKEAVYFAFPFGMTHPQFQYEIQTGAVNPATDMYPGAGHEWFSVQHWVSVQQDGASATVMPLDASLVTLGDINRGAWPSQFGERRGTIFSYVMNNYWNTNYRAGQGGAFCFRYVITSAPSTDAARLSRMGWEEMTPLETDEVILQDRSTPRPRPLNDNQDSFLDVQGKDVLVDTWKPAEDGNGAILRFLDLGGISRDISVTMPFLQLREAWVTDAVERNQKALPLTGPHGFRFSLHPHEIVTVRILGSDVLQPPSL